MKHLLATIAIISCILAQTYGQVTIGVRVGKAPNVNPGTNHLFVNSQDPINESLFNVERVQYSEQVGLMARLDRGNFWFMSELMYGQSTAQYSMIYVQEIREGQISLKMDEKRSFLELPVSAGVSIGFVDIFSGFSVARDFGFRNELESTEGYTTSRNALRAGWHSGIGVNFGQILFDIRYHQEFRNYGQGQFINGQELLLKNAPGRLLMTAAFRI
jgi:hypothetical protein